MKISLCVPPLLSRLIFDPQWRVGSSLLQELSGVPCGRVPQTNDMTNHLFGFAYWAVKVILTIEAQTSLGANAQNHLCFLCNYLLLISILWPAHGATKF